MGWYNSAWTLRLPISIDNTAGAAGAICATVDLSQMADEFWTHVLATGFDVLPTAADGKTLQTFDFNPAFNLAARTGTLRFTFTAPAEGMILAWLYFGNAAAGDLHGAPVIAGPKAGYVEVGAPMGRKVTAGPERPGAVIPAQEVYKTTSDVCFLWWDVTALLEPRSEIDQGSLLYEEMSYAQFGVEAAGAEEAGLFDEDYTRFVVVSGRSYVRTYLTAGTDATLRTARLRLGTSKAQLLDCRALVKYNNADEV